MSTSLSAQASAVILAFCQRCEIPYERLTPTPDFLQACEADIKRRLTAAIGAPPTAEYLAELRPWSTTGFTLGFGYLHLPTLEDAVFVGSFTTLTVCSDDIFEKETDLVAGFQTRFMNNQPHGHPILDALAALLREIPTLWEPVLANMLVTSTLNFINSMLHEDKTRDLQVISQNLPQLRGLERCLALA